MKRYGVVLSALISKSFYFRESVMVILELMVKHDYITPLTVKCEVRNGGDFIETGSMEMSFNAVAEGTIYLHGMASDN